MFLKAKPDLANHQIILRRATVCFLVKNQRQIVNGLLDHWTLKKTNVE